MRLLPTNFANKQQIDSEIAADEAEAEEIEKEFLDRERASKLINYYMQQ